MTVRLPTETQWEYACRAGSATHWWWGDAPAGGAGKCNAADKTGKARFRKWHIFEWEDGCVFTAPVGSYRPNAFGLYDMHGNVWEWCRDWYRPNYAQAGAPTAERSYADKSGPPRVVRGGSWLSSPGRCRSAARESCGPMGSFCDFIVGFRVAVDAAPAGAPGAARAPRDGTTSAEQCHSRLQSRCIAIGDLSFPAAFLLRR